MVGVVLEIVVLESAARTCRQKSDWRRKRDEVRESEKVRVTQYFLEYGEGGSTFAEARKAV